MSIVLDLFLTFAKIGLFTFGGENRVSLLRRQDEVPAVSRLVAEVHLRDITKCIFLRRYKRIVAWQKVGADVFTLLNRIAVIDAFMRHAAA